jgi:Glycosyltransferase family 87
MRADKRMRLLLRAALVGPALGVLIATSLPPSSYTQDLQVDYLGARALLKGEDPFTPTDALSRRYFPIPTDNFPHPNPHPPVLVALFVPLALLPYPVVAFGWLLLNLIVLLIVGRWLRISPLNSLCMILWPPLWCVLDLGQIETILLLLIVAGWRGAAAGRDVNAGICLGIAASVKPYAAFFVLPFLVRGRVRLLVAAGSILLLAQAINLAAVGPSGLARYYGEVLPSVSARYAPIGLNVSPYGALLRFFGGAQDTPPLLQLPGLVIPLAAAISLFGLISLCALSPIAAPLATFCMLPLAWYYHPVLTIPQLLVLYRSGRHRALFYVGFAATFFVLPLVNILLDWLSVSIPFRGMVPLLTGLETTGLLVLLAMSWTNAGGSRGVFGPATGGDELVFHGAEVCLRTNTRATPSE